MVGKHTHSSSRIYPDCKSNLLIGDIVYLNALGQPMVVLNSYEAAIAVLEGHSATTSSRPQSIMADLYIIPLFVIMELSTDDNVC